VDGKHGSEKGFRFAAREELEREKKKGSLAGSRIRYGEGLGRTWVRTSPSLALRRARNPCTMATVRPGNSCTAAAMGATSARDMKGQNMEVMGAMSGRNGKAKYMAARVVGVSARW